MALRGIEVYAAPTGTSQSINLPANSQAGDIATLLVAANNPTAGGFGAAGWIWHGHTESIPSGESIGVWTKALTASDLTSPANTLTVSNSSASPWAMMVMVRYGVAGLDAVPVLSGSSSLGTSVQAPSVTTVSSDVELVTVYGCQTGSSGVQVAYTLPAGQTEVANICGTSSSQVNNTLCAAEEMLPTAAPSGTRTAVSYNIDSSGVGDEVYTSAVTLAFRPLASSGPVVNVHQSGTWVQKPLRTRVGGSWV